MANTRSTPYAEQDSVFLIEQIINNLRQHQLQVASPEFSSVYLYSLVEQRTLCSSGSVAEILGYGADEIQRMDAIGLAHLIHPNDLEQVSEHYQRLTTLRYGNVLTLTYRMKDANGDWCCLHSQETSVIQAIDGFPLEVLGIVQMIDPQIANIRELIRSGPSLKQHLHDRTSKQHLSIPRSLVRRPSVWEISRRSLA